MAQKASKVIVIYVFLTMLSVLSTYALSVALGHVNPVVPYLSFTGDKPPESTLFTQCYVIDSAFLAFIVQVQYAYVSVCLAKTEASRETFTLNTAGTCIGYTAAIGLFVQACFQESHAYYVNHLAEFVYLFASIVYFVCQTVLSKVNNEEARVKLALNIFMGVFFLVFLVAYQVALRQYNKAWEERHHWRKGDGGWEAKMLSATSEWLLIFLFQCYLLTYLKNFSRIWLTNTSIIVTFQEDRESR